MSYTLGDVQTSSKGIKSAPLTDASGNPVFIVAQEHLSAPFGASAFNDPEATRKNICFRCTPNIEAQFDEIDKYMESYALENAQRLFKGKAMTYRPCLQKKEDYAPLLRCKINTAGSKSCRFWTPMYSRCDAPPDLKDCLLIPRLLVRGLWIMGAECGLQVEVTDLMCDALQETCPIINAEASQRGDV